MCDILPEWYSHGMETQNQTPIEETELPETKSRLHEVTPLSKYLAMFIFITLPFFAGWVGYQLAPEKVVEIEKIIKMPIIADNDGLELDKVQIISRQGDLTWRTEREVSLNQNGYTRAIAELRGQSIEDFINYATTTGYYIGGRILVENKFTMLTICDRCSAPSGYLIFDENSKQIVRSHDWNGVPFDDSKQWFRFNEYGDFAEVSNTLLVAVSTNEVKVYDFAADQMEVLYTETDDGVTLCGDEGIICGSSFILTKDGEIGFGRYDVTSRPAKLLEVKIVQIPDSFK